MIIAFDDRHRTQVLLWKGVLACAGNPHVQSYMIVIPVRRYVCLASHISLGSQCVRKLIRHFPQESCTCSLFVVRLLKCEDTSVIAVLKPLDCSQTCYQLASMW